VVVHCPSGGGGSPQSDLGHIARCMQAAAQSATNAPARGPTAAYHPLGWLGGGGDDRMPTPLDLIEKRRWWNPRRRPIYRWAHGGGVWGLVCVGQWACVGPIS
jgi:hypothetical protein